MESLATKKHSNPRSASDDVTGTCEAILAYFPWFGYGVRLKLSKRVADSLEMFLILCRDVVKSIRFDTGGSFTPPIANRLATPSPNPDSPPFEPIENSVFYARLKS
jgi:hypothetical protein